MTSAYARSIFPFSKSATACRVSPTATPSWAAKTSTCGWSNISPTNSEGARHRSAPRQACAAAAQESAEKAKIEPLLDTTEINLPSTADAWSWHLNYLPAKFEALVDDLVQKTVEPCRMALKDAASGRDQRGGPMAA
jgi:hypothetical protein